MKKFSDSVSFLWSETWSFWRMSCRSFWKLFLHGIWGWVGKLLALESLDLALWLRRYEFYFTDCPKPMKSGYLGKLSSKTFQDSFILLSSFTKLLNSILNSWNHIICALFLTFHRFLDLPISLLFLKVQESLICICLLYFHCVSFIFESFSLFLFFTLGIFESSFC